VIFGIGQQLAQLQPASPTTFELLVANNGRDGPRIEVTSIFVANSSGAAASFRIAHDVDGLTFDGTTALWWDQAVDADSTWIWQAAHVGGGIPLGKQGNLGFYGSTTDLTVTVYGVSAPVQERGLSYG